MYEIITLYLLVYNLIELTNLRQRNKNWVELDERLKKLEEPSKNKFKERLEKAVKEQENLKTKFTTTILFKD